jgi:hypothetical protein
MGETVKHTDLSSEDPSSRADPELRQERLKAWAKFSFRGASVGLQARFNSESALGPVVLAIALALGGCFCAAALRLMGASLWPAVALGIPLPIELHLWLSLRARRAGKQWGTKTRSRRTLRAAGQQTAHLSRTQHPRRRR